MMHLRESDRLEFSYPKHLEHPMMRTNLEAANLLEYWAKNGKIPLYSGLIKSLRTSASEISKIATSKGI
jgi:hypothetical protein